MSADLDAIRRRHAGDTHTGLPLTASDQHRRAHADRAALLAALDRLAALTEEEVAEVIARQKCHRCVRGIPLTEPGWHVGEAPCAAEVNVREEYQAKTVLALIRARVEGR